VYRRKKGTLQKAFKSDRDLFLVLNESLRMVAQWMFGKYMSFHVISHTCHHHDGLVCVTIRAGEVGSYIVHILKSSIKDHDDMRVKEGLVLDARLLDKVLKTPIIAMDSIPHTCHLASFIMH